MDSSSENKEDFDSLKESCQRLKEELDNTKCELFECKSTLKVLTSMQDDYKKEIDQLESNEIVQKQKFQEVIKHLEQSIIDIKEKFSDDNLTLNKVISSMEELRAKVTSEDWNNNPISFAGDTGAYIKGLLAESESNYYEGLNEGDYVDNYS
ncbi:unnamed protein product [Phyllotreta striolata]|uniref:Uncharacterized protein n=1 Tax=Phyllotreta striolata TaxID=444603 RepID=A0A9N9XR39_PHYSR|nr:unnamed protein product [Phyllotreta striolata]